MKRRELEVFGASSAKAAHSSEGERTWERGRLGGEEVDVLRIDLPVEHYAFASLRRPEGARLLICSSAVPGVCDEVLPVLAASPWKEPAPGTRRKSVEAVTLLGRPVGLPEGCTGRSSDDGYTTVNCKWGSTTTWFFAPQGSDIEAKMKVTEDALLELAAGKAQVRRDAFPCTLAGVETTCRRVVLTTPRGTSTYFWSWVPVSGQRLIASCTGSGKDHFAPPCTLAFGFDGAADRSLALAGLQVRVPESCRVDREYRSARIVCGRHDSFVTWTLEDDDAAAEAALEELDEGTARKVRRLDPRAQLDRIPCRVGGVACTCRRARFESPGGAATYVGAAARVDGNAILAFCVVDADGAGAVPCSLVFELE